MVLLPLVLLPLVLVLVLVLLVVVLVQECRALFSCLGQCSRLCEGVQGTTFVSVVVVPESSPAIETAYARTTTVLYRLNIACLQQHSFSSGGLAN